MPKSKEHWRRIRALRDELGGLAIKPKPLPIFTAGSHVSDYARCGLTEQWNKLGLSEINDKTINTPDQSPLTLIANIISAGDYPSPELMVWLSETVKQYMQAAGGIELENLFFGAKPSGKNAGNYSKRFANMQEALYAKVYVAERAKLRKTPRALSALNWFLGGSIKGLDKDREANEVNRRADERIERWKAEHQ